MRKHPAVFIGAGVAVALMLGGVGFAIYRSRRREELPQKAKRLRMAFRRAVAEPEKVVRAEPPVWQKDGRGGRDHHRGEPGEEDGRAELEPDGWRRGAPSPQPPQAAQGLRLSEVMRQHRPVSQLPDRSPRRVPPRASGEPPHAAQRGKTDTIPVPCAPARRHPTRSNQRPCFPEQQLAVAIGRREVGLSNLGRAR